MFWLMRVYTVHIWCSNIIKLSLAMFTLLPNVLTTPDLFHVMWPYNHKLLMLPANWVIDVLVLLKNTRIHLVIYGHLSVTINIWVWVCDFIKLEFCCQHFICVYVLLERWRVRWRDSRSVPEICRKRVCTKGDLAEHCCFGLWWAHIKHYIMCCTSYLHQ